MTRPARRRAAKRRFDLVLQRYRARINTALAKHLRLVETMPHEAATALRYSIGTEGKRLRPIVVLLACQAAGGTVRQALPTAVAAELMHLATLLYDDIIDDDEFRRGEAAVHVKFGPDLAMIIAGLLTTHAFFAVLSDSRVFRYLLESMHEMGIGAVLELRGDARDVKGYLGVAERKTGRLFQLSGDMGALAAHATPTHAAALRAYARSLGVAFQLRDDVLDVIGDPKTLGKPVGSDIRNARPSIVSILVAEELDLTLPELSRRAKPHFPPTRLRKPIAQAVARATELCGSYLETARKSLERLPDTVYRDDLQRLLDYVGTRER